MHHFNITKRGYYFSLIGIVCFTAASCKKLIEIPENPSDKIPATAVFADSVNAMSAVAGIYSNFGVVDALSFTMYNGGIGSSTGLSGDELRTTISYDADLSALYNDALLSNNGKMAGYWTESYRSLYQINSCIEAVQQSKGLNSALKQQLTGEAKVVRAFYYFNLINLFGGVPLVTGTDYQANEKLPRASVDTVYHQIITDLTDARALLTSAYPSAGPARPNRYVATALLARVDLYNRQWSDAVTMATEVIGSGMYTVQNDLDNTFLYGNQEAIWQLPAAGNSTQTVEAIQYVPGYPGATPNFYLSDPLRNAFEAGDKRSTNWVGTASISGTDYLYPDKYRSRSVSDARKEGYVVLRLAELYLIRAEAFAQQNNITDALTDLKVIRNADRVGLTEYSGPRDQTAVLAAIMKERQTELFCEWGHRWFDLKRTGQADAVLGIEKPGWQSTDALYPIPRGEIQLNNTLVQNPGYN